MTNGSRMECLSFAPVTLSEWPCRLIAAHRLAIRFAGPTIAGDQKSPVANDLRVVHAVHVLLPKARTHRSPAAGPRKVHALLFTKEIFGKLTSPKGHNDLHHSFRAARTDCVNESSNAAHDIDAKRKRRARRRAASDAMDASIPPSQRSNPPRAGHEPE